MDYECDRHGLRVGLEFEGQRIEFGILREELTDVTGDMDRKVGCPILSVEDRSAERTMANSDRGQDPSICCPDAPDLDMLVRGHPERLSREAVPPSTHPMTPATTSQTRPELAKSIGFSVMRLERGMIGVPSVCSRPKEQLDTRSY